MSSNKIPLFSDTSPGWYFKGSQQSLAVDSSAGINEYVFGRTTPDNKFIVASGLVDQNGVVKMTGAGKFKTTKPKTGKPKTGKPKTLKPKTLKPKTLKPKVVKPKVVKPKVVKPKVVKPKVVKPKVVKPKVVKPKVVKPKVVKPKVVKPKTSKLNKKYGGDDTNKFSNIKGTNDFSIQVCPKCGNMSQTYCKITKGYLVSKYGKCICPACKNIFNGVF
jgi:hypothetical protein